MATHANVEELFQDTANAIREQLGSSSGIAADNFPAAIRLIPARAELEKKEDKANKTTTLSEDSTDIQYPSAKATYDAIDAINEPVVSDEEPEDAPIGTVWIDTNDIGVPGVSAETVVNEHNINTSSHADIRSAVAQKSKVSVSSTGTATEEANYITIDGVEKKIGGSGGGGGSSIVIDNHTLITVGGITKVNATDDAQTGNDLPITSSGVNVIVGNIEVLLSTI